MYKLNYRHILYAVVLFLLATMAALWSWNTLSELFNLPQAQYKHVLAAVLLLLILRWGVIPGQHGRHSRFHNNHA